jgi:hypothetical protein
MRAERQSLPQKRHFYVCMRLNHSGLLDRAERNLRAA